MVRICRHYYISDFLEEIQKEYFEPLAGKTEELYELVQKIELILRDTEYETEELETLLKMANDTLQIANQGNDEIKMQKEEIEYQIKKIEEIVTKEFEETER